MTRLEHLRLMSRYNQWMNGRLYEAAGTLTHEQLVADRGAFFESIFGTLNHLVAGDTLWLKRFATHPAGFPLLDPVRALPKPASLDEWQAADFAHLAERRRVLDGVIEAWVGALAEADIDHAFEYANTKGVVFRRNFFAVLMHFFNHQTHHRGQATTLLTQAGVDVGVTDLLAVIPTV
ncbi:MAG: DinB family protein [Burkholderiales bacterium]